MSHLVEKLKKTFLVQIKERIDHLFDEADTWLMDRVDASRDLRLQQQYTEMMRFLKLHKSQFEREYFRCLQESFNTLQSSNQRRSKDTRPRLRDVSLDALTLVGHDEMEQNVALDSMAVRCRSELGSGLKLLQARIESLVPGTRVDADNNPIDPKVLCEALGRSVADIPWDVKHDLIFFKLFQQYVLNDYDTVISLADSVLVNAGVLKNLSEREVLQYQHQRLSQNKHNANTQSSDTQSPIKPPQTDKQASLPENRNWGQILQGALAGLQRPSAFAGPAVLGSQSEQAVTLPLPDLVALFQQLTSSHSSVASHSHWQTSELCERITHLVKEKNNTDQDFKVDAVDTNIINLVSRLFEQVLEQDTLPNRVKALIGRLQIPCIRIALVDPVFLSSSEHPARRLINEMADAGLELDGKAEGQSDVTFAKIQSVVETILNDYDDDVSLLEMLCEDFIGFREREGRRTKLLAQRMAALEEGKAKTAMARQDVTEALQRLVGEKDIPESMARILDKVWYSYLCWIHHREGKDSFAWSKALFLVEQMLVCLLPVDCEQEGEDRLVAIDELEDAIRLGARQINYQDNSLDRWLADLAGLMRENARYSAPRESGFDSTLIPDISQPETDTAETAPDSSPNAPTELTDRASRLRAPRIPVKKDEADNAFSGKVARLDLARKAPVKSEPDLEPLPENDPGLSQARNLVVGTLMDYHHQGEAVRCKLAAHIKSVDKLIFVNRAGAKLFEKSLLELAHDINQGKLILLEDAQLFDRALETVISSLRNVRDQAV